MTEAKCLDWQPFMPKELAHACQLPKGHEGKHSNLFEDPPGYWWQVQWVAEPVLCPMDMKVPPRNR